MFEAAEVISLYAETPVHLGSGASGGAVDLPIQRERHTDIPLIPASSLKGVLRDAAERKVASRTDTRIYETFGPEKGDDHGGALSVTDARLLLFPVRSLEGIFVWVTCPMVIERLVRDLALAKKPINAPSVYGLVPKNAQAKVCPNSPLRDPLVLEEYEYAKFGDHQVAKLVEMITPFMPNPKDPKTLGYEGYVSRLSTHLAVLSDTDFQHVVKTGTEIVTRIKLNEQKTTTGGEGNMWTEEFLPSDCLFYSLLLAMPTRKTGGTWQGQDVVNFVKDTVKPEILQIGGDETVGRGWMRVTFWNGTTSTPIVSTPTGKQS